MTAMNRQIRLRARPTGAPTADLFEMTESPLPAVGGGGSVVGQLAKTRGCRVVGVAGSPVKCRYVVDVLGFDACVDYKSDDFPAALAAACPSRVDVYFDNVGGAVLAAVLKTLNRGA